MRSKQSKPLKADVPKISHRAFDFAARPLSGAFDYVKIDLNFFSAKIKLIDKEANSLSGSLKGTVHSETRETTLNNFTIEAPILYFKSEG